MGLSAEQLKTRKNGIGGSEIAALVGLSKYDGPFSVYEKKVAPFVLPFKETVHTRRGTHLEYGVIGWYEEETGRRTSTPGTLIHPTQSIVIATPDAISHGEGEDIVLEVKCPSWRSARDWGQPGTDEVPEYYWPQLQWEMGVTGLKRAHAVAFFDDQINIYVVDFDADIFNGLVRVANDFWENYVVPKIPPPADGSVNAADFILHNHPRAKEPTRQADGKVMQHMVDLRDAMAEIKAQEAVANEARNQIRQWLGDSGAVESDIGNVTWRNNKDRVSVDWKAVANHMGATREVIDKHTNTAPGARVMRTRFR